MTSGGKTDGCSGEQTWVRIEFFILFNSVSERFGSTQLMTHNGFTGLDSNLPTTQNGRLEFDSDDSRLKKLFRILIQKAY